MLSHGPVQRQAKSCDSQDLSCDSWTMSLLDSADNSDEEVRSGLCLMLWVHTSQHKS